MLKRLLPLSLISTNITAASCLDQSVTELLPIDKNALYKVNQVIVSAPKRSYLYSFPDSMCKMNGVFLIKGDIARSYMTARGFHFINYYDKTGDLHVGWIDSNAVSAIKKSIPDAPSLTSRDFSIWHNGNLLTVDNKISNVYDKVSAENYADSSMFDKFRNINGVDYKIFVHESNGLYIESTNINYLALKRDFDDYRMSTIQLTSHNGTSARGIFVGVPVKFVYYVYGKPSKIDGNKIYYEKELYSLSFEIDKNKAIKNVSVDIIPQ